jgi:alkaline phosphatase D
MNGLVIQYFCQPLRILLAIAMLIITVCISAQRLVAADLYLGSGVKAGEITDQSAIVLVRLTATSGQDAEGLIPGEAGQARILFGTDQTMREARATEWKTAKAEFDHSIQFELNELLPKHRQYYRVEYRDSDSVKPESSEVFSFMTAPSAEDRAAVNFHLTTCQDIRGEALYKVMAEQHPDFCVSAGDTVYYDGQGLARNVPQAWQAYQKMFGLPAMKAYYENVGGYFMKDDHDYRFNDADPWMKGKWLSVTSKNVDPGAKFTESRGDLRLDSAWLTHEEGIRVFKQVFPMRDKTYRTVRWGKGVQIWMLENRDFRSPNDMPDGPDKSIWGAEQKAWLLDSLKMSDADYRIVISPNPIIGPDRASKGDNHANKNGFWHEGQEFLDSLRDLQLDNVILMCGDRHWQYHSNDRREGRDIHEFSCGPTCDEHTQKVPPLYEGVEQPYSASRGGFMKVQYEPKGRSLAFEFYSVTGEALYQTTFKQ